MGSSKSIKVCKPKPILKGKAVSETTSVRKRKRQMDFVVDDDEPMRVQYSNRDRKKRKVEKMSVEYPSMNIYRANPNRYFHSSLNDKERMMQCLRLCQDAFEIIKARPLRDAFGGESVLFQCSFCHRFDKESADAIDHYTHCQVVKVLDALKGKGCEDQTEVVGVESVASLDGSVVSQSLSAGTAMDSVPTIPTLPQFANGSGGYANNNFATALDKMLKKAKQ